MKPKVPGRKAVSPRMRKFATGFVVVQIVGGVCIASASQVFMPIGLFLLVAGVGELMTIGQFL